MPAQFIPAFAERLNTFCQVKIREAVDQDRLLPGEVLLAPGGQQLVFKTQGMEKRIHILPGDEKSIYRPCIDVTLTSATEQYKSHVLAIILTGMGADGREGARGLKNAGGQVWAQDKASCVVFGMPMSIIEAGLADRVMSLTEIGPHIVKTLCG
jgi:two-component system chemotaxis response regulator CheB